MNAVYLLQFIVFRFFYDLALFGTYIFGVLIYYF